MHEDMRQGAMGTLYVPFNFAVYLKLLLKKMRSLLKKKSPIGALKLKKVRKGNRDIKDSVEHLAQSRLARKMAQAPHY